MRLVIIGAAGRTGRRLTEAALGHGHEVTAFVHRRSLDFAHPRLAHYKGDAREFDHVSEAVAGHDAVAVAIGSPGQTVHEPVIANVVHAMALHAVLRISVLSAAGTFARTDPNLSIAFRARIATTMRRTYDDLEAMERRIMASSLEWTIVRPAGLIDGPPAGDYRISLSGSPLPKAHRIARADVAGVMLKSLESDTYLRRTVAIAT